MVWLRHHRGLIPYLLLAPGMLWLTIFYVYPAFQMFLASLSTRTGEIGFEFSGQISNYIDGLTTYQDQFIRSIAYGLAATIVAFLIAYPLAYTIAFRAGRWKNLMLFLVIAPFFTSFLLRTLSWKIILADSGLVLGPLKAVGLVPEEFRLLATPIAVVAGITYNFLPFMTLPLYVALEKIDKRLVEAAQDLYAGPWRPGWDGRRGDRRGRVDRAADGHLRLVGPARRARRGVRRGRRGHPLRLPVVPAGRPAAVPARGLRGIAADVHPGGR